MTSDEILRELREAVRRASEEAERRENEPIDDVARQRMLREQREQLDRILGGSAPAKLAPLEASELLAIEPPELLREAVELLREIARGERVLQRRDPIPVALVTEAVRLREAEGKSWRAIQAATGLSRRKTDYIRIALKYEDLGWDPSPGVTTLGGDTENVDGGVRLPVR